MKKNPRPLEVGKQYFYSGYIVCEDGYEFVLDKPVTFLGLDSTFTDQICSLDTGSRNVFGYIKNVSENKKYRKKKKKQKVYPKYTGKVGGFMEPPFHGFKLNELEFAQLTEKQKRLYGVSE